MRLQNKVAIVTGAGRGIGRAIAEAFAREGAVVVVASRTEHEITEVAEQIRASGGRSLPVVCDVGVEEQVGELIARAIAAFGRLDIMVNNAAISAVADFLHTPHDEWQRVVQVNLFGAVFGARSAAQAIIAGGTGGRIINISSIHAYRGEPGSSHYDVAKGGMDQLTRTLAIDLAPHGILVNSIAPGFIDTALSVVDGVNELESDWFKDIYVARRKIPLARPGQPDEIASVAVFLASDESSYMTGHVLVVDGGLSVTF